MAWTAPRTWATNEVVTAAQLNAHLRDNTAYLHKAKHAWLGRLGSVTVPDSTYTSLAWDFAVEQDPTVWASTPYPERVAPPLPGVWLVTCMVRWEASTATGFRALRLQLNGTQVLRQARSAIINFAQEQSVTMAVRLNGAGDYINAHVWQNSGSTQTLEASVGRDLTMTWMGS